MRQRLVSQRLRGEHEGPLAAFRDVVFVDVEGEFDDRAQGPGRCGSMFTEYM